MYEAFLLRVEQEKLSIAAYEIEQTKLDWERMKVNAQISLEGYDVCENRFLHYFHCILYIEFFRDYTFDHLGSPSIGAVRCCCSTNVKS